MKQDLSKQDIRIGTLVNGAGKPAEVACVGANPQVFGKARVARSGDEEVDLVVGVDASVEVEG